MARGWESKSVADQIDEGREKLDRSREANPDALAREAAERLRSLQLSRSRLLQQLELAKHPAHRAMLQKGLQAIEAEIDALPKPGPPKLSS